MFRCRVLFNFIIEDLMDAAEAMADGSYWDDPPNNGDARDYYGGGFDPHGDGG